MFVEFRDVAVNQFITLHENAENLAKDLVGDRDNFHPGDTVDTPSRSQRVEDLLEAIGTSPGQNPTVDLDIGGFNRPVGFTHLFVLPEDARPTSAKIKFRLRGEESLVYNDGIWYDESNPPQSLVPVIALRDLLGREPAVGETLDLEMNLGKVPVRTVDTTGGPGGHFSPAPEEYRNLLPLLFDRKFDMVFGDDVMVDFSEFTMTFVSPSAPSGDLTGDSDVDRDDLTLILGVLNTGAYGPNDPRDLNGDGAITVLDARKLVLLCTRPRCATE